MITIMITETISMTLRIPSGRDGAGPPLGPGRTARLAAPRPGAILDLVGRQSHPGLSMPGTRTTYPILHARAGLYPQLRLSGPRAAPQMWAPTS